MLSRTSPATRDRLCEVAVAFPVAFMLHIWGDTEEGAEGGARGDKRGYYARGYYDHRGREARFEAMVEGVFAEASTLATIAKARHRPLALIEHAVSVIHEALGPGGSDVQRASPLEAAILQRLLNSAQGLGVPLSGCERIQGTPLPFVYVAHLRFFLVLVLCLVPFMFACQWQWQTVPLSLLVALALLGIEAASVECERPFSDRPSKNHHDVERFAVLLSTEVSHMLLRADARAAGDEPPPSPHRRASV